MSATKAAAAEASGATTGTASAEGKISAQLGEIIDISTDRGITLRNLEELAAWAELVLRSEMAPQALRSRAKIMVATQAGMELGFSPLAALRSVYVVNGLPALMGAAAVALILRSGKAETWESGTTGEGDDMTGWVETKRVGMRPQRFTFSMAEAKKAGIVGKPGSAWANYPGRMLVWRAVSFASKSVYPDVLMGIDIAEDRIAAQKVEREEITAPLPPILSGVASGKETTCARCDATDVGPAGLCSRHQDEEDAGK